MASDAYIQATTLKSDILTGQVHRDDVYERVMSIVDGKSFVEVADVLDAFGDVIHAHIEGKEVEYPVIFFWYVPPKNSDIPGNRHLQPIKIQRGWFSGDDNLKIVEKFAQTSLQNRARREIFSFVTSVRKHRPRDLSMGCDFNSVYILDTCAYVLVSPVFLSFSKDTTELVEYKNRGFIWLPENEYSSEYAQKVSSTTFLDISLHGDQTYYPDKKLRNDVFRNIYLNQCVAFSINVLVDIASTKYGFAKISEMVDRAERSMQYALWPETQQHGPSNVYRNPEFDDE